VDFAADVDHVRSTYRQIEVKIFVFAGFRGEVDENCALLGYYATSSSYFFGKNYHYSLHNNPEERRTPNFEDCFIS